MDFLKDCPLIFKLFSLLPAPPLKGAPFTAKSLDFSSQSADYKPAASQAAAQISHDWRQDCDEDQTEDIICARKHTAAAALRGEVKLPITSCLDVPADFCRLFILGDHCVSSHADEAGIEKSPVKTRQSEEQVVSTK